MGFNVLSAAVCSPTLMVFPKVVHSWPAVDMVDDKERCEGIGKHGHLWALEKWSRGRRFPKCNLGCLDWSNGEARVCAQKAFMHLRRQLGLLNEIARQMFLKLSSYLVYRTRCAGHDFSYFSYLPFRGCFEDDVFRKQSMWICHFLLHGFELSNKVRQCKIHITDFSIFCRAYRWRNPIWY